MYYLEFVKRVYGLFVFLMACSSHESKNVSTQRSFPVLEYQKNEWVFYEGRWKANDGYVKLELGLKSGAFGIDSDYSLYQVFVNETQANGSGDRGKYFTISTFHNGELGICIRHLHPWDYKFLRYPSTVEGEEEMFFITRGNDELIPCDDEYKPLTTDWRYTLHKRSNLFTVEGYITFDADSAEFYERNVMQKWKLVDLEVFPDLKSRYKQTAKERFEGIYLKALAYSIADTMPDSERRLLVIKDIKGFDNDPN